MSTWKTLSLKKNTLMQNSGIETWKIKIELEVRRVGHIENVDKTGR